MNKNDLKNFGIKTEFGWYNIKKMQEILDFIVYLDKNFEMLTEDEFGGYGEITHKGYNIQVFKAHDGEFNVDIGVNKHIIAESEDDKILSHCFATAVMRLHGYQGVFTANDIGKIIAVMKEANLEYSDWCNEQW